MMTENGGALALATFDCGVQPTWCPGCGDFGVLRALKLALVQLGIEPHKVLIVTGVGCGSKLPDYVNAYGMLTLHGRPLPFATGAKLANPDLHVIAPYIDLHHSRRDGLEQHLSDACRPMLVELDCWSGKSRDHLRAAWAAQQQTAATRDEDTGDITVAVVGHLYAERDPFLNLGVTRLLRGQGARIASTPDPLPEEPVPLERDMYYESSVRSARAIEHHLASGVDGIVLLTYFACGPDSYTADTLLYRLRDRGLEVPVMRLVLDEHTAPEGMVTRVATFVEMAREQRRVRDRRC